jgi:hypothetical protein
LFLFAIQGARVMRDMGCTRCALNIELTKMIVHKSFMSRPYVELFHNLEFSPVDV